MAATAHRTVDSRAGVPRVPVQRAAPADPVAAPPHRVRVPGHYGPPTRRRVAGAPRVIAATSCAPRRQMPFLVLVATGAAVCLAVVGLGTLASSVGPDPAVPAGTEVVFVKPGESLSEVAARVAPSFDTSAVVDRILELNGGLTQGVRAGQPLRVPAEE